MVCWSGLAFGQPPPEVFLVRGKVVDAKDGHPLAGAIAGLRLPDKEGNYKRVLPIQTMNAVTTDSEGKFTFLNIPEGEYQLNVSVSSYNPVSQKVMVAPGQPTEMEVRMTPYNAIVGVLRNPEGAPGASLTVYGVMQYGGSSPLPISFQTDAQGRYRLLFYAAAPHRLLLRVMGLGSEYAECNTKADEDLTLDLRLQPSCSIAGLVKDKLTDKPVGGITVSALPMGETGVTALPAPYPAIGVATDADGKFLVKDVPAGLWSLQAGGNPLYSCPSARVPLQAGQQLEGVVFTATPAATVRGVVLGLHGKPLTSFQNMVVELCTRQNDGKYSLAPQSVSELPGRFLLCQQQPGDVQVRVFLDREGYAASSWMKAEEGKEVEVEFRLRPFQQIAGVVREKGTNRSIPGAVVKAEPVTEGEPPIARAAGGTCDSAGRFVLANVAPAEYSLTVTAEGFASAPPTRIRVGEEEKMHEIVVELPRATEAK